MRCVARVIRPSRGRGAQRGVSLLEAGIDGRGFPEDDARHVAMGREELEPLREARDQQRARVGADVRHLAGAGQRVANPAVNASTMARKTCSLLSK